MDGRTLAEWGHEAKLRFSHRTRAIQALAEGACRVIGSTDGKRVPFTGTEKESLVASLDRHRDVVLWKLVGLDDAQLREPMTPSGTSMLGLVKHLASVEYGWFCETFDRPAEPVPFDPEDPDADWRVGPDETVEAIWSTTSVPGQTADEVIAELDVDDLGRAWFGDAVSMRWVLIHMIEETARHAGHLDIIRELIDGQTGDHPPT